MTLPGATAQHRRSHSARQSAGESDSARASAGWPSASSASRVRSRMPGSAFGASESERAERLAAVREAVLDERAQALRAAPGCGGAGRRSTESTFGTGWKTLRGILRDDAHVARELGEHGRDAVGRGARPGREALADLLLHHRHPACRTLSSSIVRRITVAATP